MPSSSIRPATRHAAQGQVRASRPRPATTQALKRPSSADELDQPALPLATEEMQAASPETAAIGLAAEAPMRQAPGTPAAREPALPSWTEWAAFSALTPARGLRPWASWAARSSHNAMLGVALLPTSAMQLQALQELMQLQQASQQQAQRLLQQWLRRWATLWQDHRQQRPPNTLSKWLDEHFNLVAQSLDLLGQQASELANLEENIGVNFGYWAQQRLGVRRDG